MIVNGVVIGTASLLSQSTNLDTTLTGWTTGLTKDDKIQFEVTSNYGIKNVILTIFYTKTFLL